MDLQGWVKQRLRVLLDGFWVSASIGAAICCTSGDLCTLERRAFRRNEGCHDEWAGERDLFLCLCASGMRHGMDRNLHLVAHAQDEGARVFHAPFHVGN